MSRQVFDPTTYSPKWRFHRAREAEATGDDAWVRRYRDYLLNFETSVDEDAKLAKSLNTDGHFRARLEAFMTAGAGDTFCAEYFSIAESAVEFYRMIFFDLEPVRGEGSRGVIILRAAGEAQSEECKLKELALRYGIEVLRWRLGEPIQLSKLQVQGLYDKVALGLIMRLQQLELATPGSQKYSQLLKTLDSAIRLREYMDKDSRGTGDSLIEMLRKNLTDKVTEPVLDLKKVARSKAIVSEKSGVSDE
jgi:hypothetical protein